jgi:RHS repeat-associated protein
VLVGRGVPHPPAGITRGEDSSSEGAADQSDGPSVQPPPVEAGSVWFDKVRFTKQATLPPNLYTGREFDGETGQYNYRACYYDPKAGRFLNTDPAADDADNLYRYVGNNATNETDPSGMFVNSLFKTAGAAIGGAWSSVSNLFGGGGNSQPVDTHTAYGIGTGDIIPNLTEGLPMSLRGQYDAQQQQYAAIAQATMPDVTPIPVVPGENPLRTGPSFDTDDRSWAEQKWDDIADYFSYDPMAHSWGENVSMGQSDSYARRVAHRLVKPAAFGAWDVGSGAYNLARHPIDSTFAMKHGVENVVRFATSSEARAQLAERLAGMSQIERQDAVLRFGAGASVGGWAAGKAGALLPSRASAMAARIGESAAGPSGPVVYRPPQGGATPQQLAQMLAYTRGSNEALEAGMLSRTGRVSTAGALREAASNVADLERIRAAAAGTPYVGHVGHVPDATWTGRAVPYAWLDLSPKVNTSLGSQAAKYPVGYRPTQFILEVP